MTARDFAILCHGDQSYGNYQYYIHLDAVHAVLVEFGCKNQALFDAAYLHDVLEDTTLTVDFLEKLFPHSVNVVWAVTNCQGENRKVRVTETYIKIGRQAGATELKLADRIANVRHCIKTHDSRLSMYQQEQEYFQHMVRFSNENEAMWDCLNTLLEIK